MRSESPTTDNLIAYHDFFVRKIRHTPGVLFINATEGGILTEAVEILSLRDALYQCCDKKVRIRFPSAFARAGGQLEREKTIAAIAHLGEVLRSRSRTCSCLDGFLEFTAKKALLQQDIESVNRSILSGWRACEEICRNHAEGGAASAHRGYARAGVDV